MLTDRINDELRSFIVANYLFGRGERLQDNLSFLDNGLVDSTGILELVSHLEQQYGIRVEDEELVPDNLDSLAALTRYVQRKLSGHEETIAMLPADQPEAMRSALRS